MASRLGWRSSRTCQSVLGSMGILLIFVFDYIQDTQSHRFFLGCHRLLLLQTESSIRFSKCKPLIFLAFMSFVTITSSRKARKESVAELI
jgi:hypothetical protein